MSDPEKRLAVMLDKLRDRGFRLTPQRIAVLKILATSAGHPSVERIYEQVKTTFPTTSLATIYKTIALLKELNEVLELGFSDDSNRYDGNRPYPHPHIVCVKCREIIDPDIQLLSDFTEEVTQKTGYRIIKHRLDFFGVCPKCQAKGA